MRQKSNNNKLYVHCKTNKKNSYYFDPAYFKCIIQKKNCLLKTLLTSLILKSINKLLLIIEILAYRLNLFLKITGID